MRGWDVLSELTVMMLIYTISADMLFVRCKKELSHRCRLTDAIEAAWGDGRRSRVAELVIG